MECLFLAPLLHSSYPFIWGTQSTNENDNANHPLASFLTKRDKVCIGVATSQGAVSLVMLVSAIREYYTTAILLHLGVAATPAESAGSLGQVAVITQPATILVHHFGALTIARTLEQEMKRSSLVARSWMLQT